MANRKLIRKSRRRSHGRRSHARQTITSGRERTPLVCGLDYETLPLVPLGTHVSILSRMPRTSRRC